MKTIINFLFSFFLNAFIVYIIFTSIENIINYVLHSNIDLFNHVNSTSSTSSSTGISQDPVRWWPSGTAQSWGVIGAAIAMYRTIPGSPRVKATAAFSSLGITVPTAVLSMAVENPNGFNTLMYSWIQYKKTGQWPSPNNSPNTVSDETVDKAFENASNTKVSDHLNKFIGDGSDISNYINSVLDSLLKNFISMFNIQQVEGFFDELDAFIWLCQILLFIISIEY